MKHLLSGIVGERKIKWDNPGLATNIIQSFDGKRVSVEIELFKRKRSYLQNAYYWGVVIEMLYATFRAVGDQFGREQVHEMLRKEFLQRELIGPGGEVIGTYSESTAKLSTLEFMNYIADIQQWASEKYGVVIPDP